MDRFAAKSGSTRRARKPRRGSVSYHVARTAVLSLVPRFLRQLACCPRASGTRSHAPWLLALTVLVAYGGCLFGRRDGPVPADLMRSRQLTLRGVRALERGQSADAEKLLREAVTSYPVDPEARRQYAAALWQAGKQKQALNQIGWALQMAADDPTLHLTRSQYLLELGNLRAALASAQRAIDLDPNLGDAWAMRARVHRRRGNLAGALADYHRSLGVNPQDRAILQELASLHWSQAIADHDQQKHLQQAAAALNVLLETYAQGEEPYDVLLMAGQIQSQLGKLDVARPLLAAACERVPDSVEARYHLAQVELSSGRTVEALRHVRAGLHVDPNHQPSLQLLDEVQSLLAQLHGVRPRNY